MQEGEEPLIKSLYIIFEGDVSIYKSLMIPHELEPDKLIKQEFKVMSLSVGDLICEDYLLMELQNNQNPDLQINYKITAPTKSIVVDSIKLTVF